MTPVIGLVIAAVVALLAANARSVVVAVLALMTAATAVQTWDLGADWGSNPPSTISQPSYWVVQLIIIGVIVAVGLTMFRLRERRAARRRETLVRPAFSGRRGVVALVQSVLGLTVVTFSGAFAASRVGTTHGHGASDIPWTGVLGLAIGVVALVALAAALVAGARTDRRRTAGG